MKNLLVILETVCEAPSAQERPHNDTWKVQTPEEHHEVQLYK